MSQVVVTKQVLESFRDNKHQWRIVQDGLKCTEIGLYCMAGGFVTTSLLGFAVAMYVNATVGAIVSIIGGLAAIIGLGFLGVGLVQCLLVPQTMARNLLLSGILLAVYGLHLTLFRMFSLFTAYGDRGNGDRGAGQMVEQFTEQLRTGQLSTVVLSTAANVFVATFLLALAAFVGSEQGIKRVRQLWTIQFGGLLILVALIIGAGYLGDALLGVGPVITVFLVAIFTAGVIWFQAKLVEHTRGDLAAVQKAFDQKAATAKRTQPSARRPSGH